MENCNIWKKDFNVNVMDIDKEHYELFNKLLKISNDIKNQIFINDPLFVKNQILKSFENSFRTEEFYFNKFRFNDKLNHIKNHQYLLNKIDFLLNDFDQYNTINSISILNKISLMLIEHINTDDLKFGLFIKEKSQSYFFKAFG